MYVSIVKVRLQTNAKHHLFRELYRGILSPLIYSPIVWTVNFALYQKSLKIFKSNEMWNILFAGACSGFAWSIIVCPFEISKCYSQRYHIHSIQSVLEIKKCLGLQGIYRGLGACFARDIPLCTAYFGVLEFCRQYIPNYEQSTFLYPFLTGFLCGSCALFVGMPGDCIKSNIQTNFVNNSNISSSFMINMKSYTHNNGYIALFRGISPALLKHAIVGGCAIVCIEFVNKLLYSHVSLDEYVADYDA